MSETTEIDKASLKSKVLLVDTNKDILPVTKLFLDEANLIGVRANKSDVMEVLKSNVDLGAILLAESYDDNPVGGIEMARQIHAARPELPIFLRREKHDNLDNLDEDTRRMFCAAYTIGSLFRMRKVVDEYIFCLIYPNLLVRGIQEITERVLDSQNTNSNVVCDTPYVVGDRIIVGDTVSLIPLESTWCRGYMMLQVADPDDNASPLASKISDRLGEITNLVWGEFKNRYISDEQASNSSRTQVPLLIKLNRKYISFGSDDPQLCFKYVLTDRDDPKISVVLSQRFIFNLSWSPEAFKEIHHSVESLVDSGELEFF